MEKLIYYATEDSTAMHMHRSQRLHVQHKHRQFDCSTSKGIFSVEWLTWYVKLNSWHHWRSINFLSKCHFYLLKMYYLECIKDLVELLGPDQEAAQINRFSFGELSLEHTPFLCHMPPPTFLARRPKHRYLHNWRSCLRGRQMVTNSLPFCKGNLLSIILD